MRPKHEVSVRAKTHAKLKHEAQRHGVTVSELVSELINAELAKERPP